MLIPIFNIGGGVSIKSIQQVSIVLNSVTSNTATITSVDTTNAFIIYDGTAFPSAVTDGAHGVCRVDLTNATTVTARVNTSSASNITVRAVVIEFNSGAINSIQSGTIAVTSNTTNTATITSVNTAKSFVIYLGHISTSGAGATAVANANVTLTNATTVTATSSFDSGAGTITLGYMVVEFK